MNPFTTHPQMQGVTYITHMKFAMGIAIRLLHSVFAFGTHAVFPFINIRRALDLEATSRYLQRKNSWIDSQKFLSPTIGEFSQSPEIENYEY